MVGVNGLVETQNALIQTALKGQRQAVDARADGLLQDRDPELQFKSVLTFKNTIPSEQLVMNLLDWVRIQMHL